MCHNFVFVEVVTFFAVSIREIIVGILIESFVNMSPFTFSRIFIFGEGLFSGGFLTLDICILGFQVLIFTIYIKIGP